MKQTCFADRQVLHRTDYRSIAVEIQSLVTASSEVICSSSCRLWPQDAQAAQRKRAAAHKRQLAEVEQRTVQIMAATEVKIKALRKKAGKMTSLARVLQPFAKAQTCGSPSV